MKGKSKKVASTSILIVLLIAVITALCTSFVKTVSNSKMQLSSEHLRAMSYAELTEDDSKVENSEYVRFSAFFTRDLDGDGNAEKLKGTCKNINATDMLYMDLNVLSSGTLKNGKITITGNNFNYSMSMIKDSVLKYNYISDDVTVIELNDVQAGTQKLILGKVIADIGNDTKNYSKESTITLTGTHVSENGNIETEINKTIDVTVDWYGDVSASLYTYNSTYYYDNLSGNTVSFSFYINENEKELLLKDAIATCVIPELNGYAPTSVVCQDGSVIYEYNEETRTLTITRSSKIDENGIITSSLSRSNTFRVYVTYPEEAFNQITSYTTLNVPVTGEYVAYNNENDEFENPHKSNIVNGNITIVFRETPKGEIYNFYVDFLDKKYVQKPSYNGEYTNYRYVISKQDILNLYDNYDEESTEEIKNKEYVVKWLAVRGSEGVVHSMIMSETKEEGATTETGSTYGDKWNSTIMEQYVTNTGIYFANADNFLEEDGTISVYNNDTNELIKTFTKEEWNNYTRENPYKYEIPVKHIRVETSKTNLNCSVSVYNVKELETAKVLENFTKEQVKDIELVYTYLTGICNIEGQESETRKDIDYAYYISEKSNSKITVEKEKLSTQETLNNQKIYIDAIYNQEGDAKWQNGEFLVEVPEEIINMEINNVTINNEKVKIVAYDLFEENGKYFIKVITENEEPVAFKITIDCNITPDPRIATINKEFKLYSYNKYCNDYYYQAEDVYDVDSDNNIEEQVGLSATNIQLLSPTALITLETVSDYNEEKEITIAPNVALVEREARQAKINISLTNNYPNTVDGVKILGKIPFEGNTYIIHGKDLKSEFTTTMTSNGINNSDENPTGVKEKTVIYYSENENPSQDVTDIANGWMLLEDVKDFSKIKTYLIDVKNNKIEVGKEIKFDYDINLPENISYNLASFSNHAVYYNLNTEGGNLSLSTEPNKVGVRIVNKFDLELTKYKVNSNITIPGVTYALKYKEKTPEGILEDKTRILTTNIEGKILLNNLLAETEYTLQEIKVPNICEINAEKVTFTINEDLTVTLNGNTRNYEFTTGEILKLELEDEIKYNVEINKTKTGSNIPINNVRFLLQDEEGKKNQVRTQNGIGILEGLSLNKVYTISEAVVPGNCELNDGVFKFKLVRNNNLLELVTVENSLVSGTPTIQDLETELTPVLKLNVQNEIKYTLNLTKQDLEGNKIGGVKFTVKGEGFGAEGTKYTTSKDGKISVSGLLVGRNYTIEEIQAIGYYLDSEKVNNIQFRVDRTGGSLQITTWNIGNGIIQSGTQTISEQDLTANINVTLENEKVPTYNLKIVKQNDEGEILPGAQFKLTSLDTGAEKIITIDENGEGIFENLYEFIDGKCVTGEYTLQEIYSPEGYVVNKNILKFKGAKNAEGKVEITLLEGNELIKIDEETTMPLITSTENDATFTIMNEPVFSLKKYGDNNSLLPNAKFVITDLDGNQVTDVNGEVVGTEETINGNTYKVVTTSEKGEITADLPEGLYKVVEVAAPEGYKLAENEADRTYYFGIGENRPAETSGTVDTIKWAKSVKSKLSSKFYDAVATDDGGSIAVGKAEVNIDIDGDGIPDGIDKGNKDGIIVKYSSEGNIEWSKILGGINDDEIYGITKVPTGGYVLVGYSSTSTVYFDGTLIDVENYGNEDGIIIKIDENGNYLWSQCIGGDKIDEITDVAVSEDGDIAVVGSYYSSPLYMDKEKKESLTNRGNQDSFISVYSSDGVYRWAQNIGGTGDVYAKSVISTSNGFVVGANFLGTVYVDTAGTTSVASKGSADGIIIGYSKEGDYRFSRQIGGTINDTISDVILVNDNETEGQKDIIVVGGYASSIDIDEDGTNDLTTNGTYSYDGMIVKFTERGDYIKSLSIGGSSDDTISTILATQDGGLLFGGWTYSSTVDLNKDGTNDITSNGGISDGLIAKLNADDELEWFDSIKGNSYDKVSKVLQAEDGNFIAVGDYESSSLTAMGKVGILTNSKFKDAFIIKYGETETTSAIPEMQRISIKNDLMKYKITTEIAPNSEGVRTGGTITGEYSDLYTEENNIRFAEYVKYGYDNSSDIIIQSWADYEITRVTINGEEINVKPDETGKITLPAGYFKNMQEDKHIVVNFVNKNHSLTIDKQDEEGNKLPGATFEITTNNDTPEFGALHGNGATYIEPGETKEVAINGALTQNGINYAIPIKENEVTGVIGELTDNGSYVFTESDGKYIPNNKGISGSTANSYMVIDLSDKTGNYVVVVNAQVSSEGNCDFGYATITEGIDNTTAPTYSNATGQFIKISGTSADVTTATDYNSYALEGGKKYLLHLGYRKDGSVNTGEDIFTVNSVNVYEADVKTYYFEEQDGVYTPNNTAVANTKANSYIPIDLREKTGKYAIFVNAETSGSTSSYLYAALTTNETAPEYNSSNKIMYLSGTQTAKNYTIMFDAGSLYYLHLGYSNSATTNTAKINSIKLYETKEVTYGFTESEGTYTSNNQNKEDTVANSYIPLDLTNYGGEYELKINAQISSQSGYDYGYVNITNSQTAPGYSSTVGQLIKISGNVSAKDYQTVLKGGNIYYIHLGYYKNASTSSGEDTFKINSISVTPVIKTYTVTTDDEGRSLTELDYGKYTIKEIEAPEHYVLSDEIVETEITPNDGNKTVVIVNKKKPQIIVHHYLKDGDTYTTTKLAEDEITEGTLGEDYTTSPKMDIENYILEKDSNGDYVIPSNAAGKFTDGVQEIIYYYEEKPVTLTVHHYLEGTEDTLTEDIVESLKKESTYKTVASEDVLKDYELVSVDGTTEGTITEDTVVIYYYKKKVHNITTEVLSHEEQRTDTLLNQKVSVQAFGGTITGEYTENYKEEDNIKFVEEVKQKEDSIAEITATPDAGYEVKLIKLISTSETGTQTETVIFGTDASDTAEISYTQNADGSVTLTTFEEVIEDKHIQVEFEPLEGTVITHHIIRGETTDYQTLTKSDLIGEPYQTGKIDIEHYKLVETSDNVTGTFEEDVTHVYYYYDKENYIYSVHYFYDGVEDTSKTDKILAEWQSKVTTYTDKNIPGYKFEKVEPLNDEGNLELTISDNADNNIINVYYIKDTFGYKIEHYYEDKLTHEYVKDETLTDEKTAEYQDVINITDEDKKVKTEYEYERADNEPLTVSYVVEDNIIKLYYGLADFSYSVHYFYDGVEDTSKIETSEAEFASKITTYTDKNIPGYKFEKVEPINSEGNLELTITENADNNIINVYYSRDIFGYKIEHYYEDPITHQYEKDETLTDEKTAMHKDVINITDENKKFKTGYEYEKAENNPLTVSYTVENNIIKLYYGLADFSYSVHYFYDGVEDESNVETSEAEFASKITEYIDKNKTGYKFEKVEPLNGAGNLELTISEDSNQNVINVYYVKDNFEYTVHYFYDGVEDTSKIETSTAEYASKITTYKDKVIPGYRLEKVTPLNESGNVELTITENPLNNVINVFYKTNYEITTDVIEHTENYKDGTVMENVKGGSISGEDETPFENVFKGDSSKKEIKIVPIKSEDEEKDDVEYEIVKVVIKDGKQDKDGTELDLSKLIDKDGNVVLPEGYFENMQSNKHIEVEFRRKTKVIVKHLEEGTEKVLYETEDGKDYEEIIGYEGKPFETFRRIITNYQASDLGITDENKVETNANGTMFADVITIIYWYERIPSGITVKHIEIDEKEIKDGLTLESGVLLEEENINGKAGLIETTKRKTYENYLAVDGPESTNSNIVIVGKSDNEKEVTYLVDNTLEVRYYYERQYNITTDVKEHKELVNGVETNVKGGKISGEDLESYENIFRCGNNEKTIEIVPEDGYRVKSIMINEKEVVVKDLESNDHKVVLPKAYFTDVKENKHIVVEFEKIPAKVIVKYIDEYTKESIIIDKVVEGFVNDEYNESRVLIDNYISVEPEPENTKGKMTEDDITVIYYYSKQFKITTDVKEHLEDKEKNVVEVIVDKVHEIIQNAGTSDNKNITEDNVASNDSNTTGTNNTENNTNTIEDGTTENKNNSTENSTNSKDDNTENTTHDILTPLNPAEIQKEKIAVKGGTITGEDETPYETVLRGKNNKKQIEIIPDEGYRIKSVILKDGETESTLSVPDLLTKENTIILPEEYFKNMQADKHIVVEFEPIPAKVLVNYLDIETKDKDNEEPKEVAKQEIGKGFVNYEYKTHEKEIPYYELVKEELPENAEGKLTKEDTIVNYWYRKLLFNMKITKEFSSIKVNGNEILGDDKKFVKVDIANTDVANTNISVKYKLTVTNTEEIEGNATIVEHIPAGFNLGTPVEKVDNVAEAQNPNTNDTWQEKDGEITLTTRNLKPGETAEYEVTLEWDKNLNCIGSLVNTATITQTQNIPEFTETKLEDNTDSCTLLLAIRTRENRDVKTIISISCFVLAGLCTIVYVVGEVKLRKNSEK